MKSDNKRLGRVMGESMERMQCQSTVPNPYTRYICVKIDKSHTYSREAIFKSEPILKCTCHFEDTFMQNRMLLI